MESFSEMLDRLEDPNASPAQRELVKLEFRNYFKQEREKAYSILQDASKPETIKAKYREMLETWSESERTVEKLAAKYDAPRVTAAATSAANNPPRRGLGAFVLFLAVAIVALLTVPDRGKHEAALREAVTASLKSTDANNGGEVAAKALALYINAKYKDDPGASYIDAFGCDYHSYFLFSVISNKDRIIAVGAFTQVYVRSLDDTSHEKQ